MVFRSFLLAILWVISLNGFSQITTNPEFPSANQSVTITFNSSQSSMGMFTNNLYAHTGVIIEGNDDWQHVVGDWGDNTAQPQLTNKGDGIYELEITPDIYSFYDAPTSEKIEKLAFVFRSADGSQQTTDLFVDVHEEGLIVSLTTPEANAILKMNEDISLSATSSTEGALALYLNDDLLAETTGTEIETTQQFSTSGTNWLIAKIAANEETAYDSVQVYIKEEVTEEAKPASYKKGINYPDNTSAGLVLWAPEKEFVYVIGDFNNWEIDEAYQMKKDGDYFWLTIDNLEADQSYLFQYDVDGELKIADPYTNQIADPWNDEYIESSVFPDLPSYPTGKTTGIASVLHPGATEYNWQVTDFQSPSKDEMVIYELLVRDFTEDHTYQAVIEKLDYLEDLNINVLELMPVNEFEGNSSWGYNPSFYFAPDKYYGTSNELKALIDECHQRGIAVVIDLVLNHSYGQSPFVQLYWNDNLNRPAANNPWYNETSNFQNPDAQWGYDFNHDSEYTRELVDSINSFWMNEYQVDGFRFDFTKGFSNTSYGASSWGSPYDASRIANLKRMADEIWERNDDAIVIFEHLADNSEEKELADYGIMLWGNMNYNYAEAAMGYTNNSNLTWGIYSERDWDSPNLVTYMESHDEERVTYKVLEYGSSSGDYNTKTLSTATDRLELNNVFFIPLPGPKMIWQMGELAYDYSIDYNGRLGEKPVKWDYADEKDRTDLFRVISKLNYLKQTYEEFQNSEISYSLTGETKWYQLSKNGNHVMAIGNFAVTEKTMSVTFPTTGTWYDYFSETTVNVSSTEMQFTLAPGEYHLFTSRELEHPQIVTETSDLIQPKDILIYPNPATGFVMIQSENSLAQANLYSIQGSLVYSFKTTGKLNRIPLYNFKPGLYLLSLKTETSSQTIKLIKN